MTRTGAVVVARLSSSRLPGKALLPILGKPMIARLAERVRRSRLIDDVIIATSDDPSDDPLEALAAAIDTGCHRGPLHNIMERVRGAAERYECGTVVEILGDNPLVHADLIDDVVSLHRSGGYDYSASVTREYGALAAVRSPFAAGIRVQVYSFAAAAAHSRFPEYLATDKGSAAYIYEHPDDFRLGFLEATGRWSALHLPDVNLAVNYRKNFDATAAIFERLYPADSNFTLQDAIAAYRRDPALQSQFGA